jgi:hypothetical protein
MAFRRDTERFKGEGDYDRCMHRLRVGPLLIVAMVD